MRKLLTLALVSLLSAAAHAGSIPFGSDESASTESVTATFDGSISYDAGQVAIFLHNTSPAANGGYITGFVFNKAPDITLALIDGGTFTATGATTAPPFGSFDAGAALGGNWTGGGSPNAGLAPGDSYTYLFSATAARTLTADDFWIQHAGEPQFVVRFRGFKDGSSDKVPATIVPLPAAAWMGLSSLALVVLPATTRRLRRALAL